MPKRTGANTLRAIVRNMDATRESLNDRFTVPELIAIYSAHLASEWDIYPDQWEERQLQEAILGKVPHWDANERPVYDKTPAKEQPIDQLQELLESIDLTPVVYSGRGMQGGTCLAVVVQDNALQALARITEAAPSTKIAAKIARALRMDSLGHDTVLYWPDVPFKA